MSTFRKTAIVLALTALASSSVGQAESLGYYGYEGPVFNNFGGPGYADATFAPNAPMGGYGGNGYVQQAQGYGPSAQGYNNGFDQQPPPPGFGGPNFGSYGGAGPDVPGNGDFHGYGVPPFEAYPYAQYGGQNAGPNGSQNGAPFPGYPGYGNFNPAQAVYGPPPPSYGHNYSYNQTSQPPYPGFGGQNNWGNGFGSWNDGPWNYDGRMNGGQGFDNYGPGYGPGPQPYGTPSGYAEYSYSQRPAYGYGAPEFDNNGYYSQPYAGFGRPANWGSAPGYGWGGGAGNGDWSGAPWGSAPSGWDNNYGPNNGRSNSNGWGFQHGWGRY